MSRTPEEYETEIAGLQAELSRLRESVRLSSRTPSSTPGSQGSQGTVAGIEELVLSVGADRLIKYVNVPMARLLGSADRNALLGASLAEHDRIGLSRGTLTATVESASSLDERVEVERVFPGLAGESLPGLAALRPNCDPILRFIVTPRKGSFEVVVQDVTRLRWLEDTFARYVPPSVIGQMLQRPVADFMEIERREISMLFVDMRSFVRSAQSMEPRDLAELLNQFFTRMVACIEAQEGTVDKLVGDQVIGLFGAPLPTADHALRALCCATQMLKGHAEDRRSWAAHGWPAPEIGIGVTSGLVVVGNVGTPRRMSYTALGHWMNVAARLCGGAAGGQILTVPTTHQQAHEAALRHTGTVPLPRFHFRREGPRAFKNVEAPIEVLSVSAE